MNESTDTGAKGGRATLLSMLFGYFPAQALYVATRVGLADQLAGGARPAPELAAATGCDPRALRRLLRALVVIGVLDQPAPDDPDTFAPRCRRRPCCCWPNR